VSHSCGMVPAAVAARWFSLLPTLLAVLSVTTPATSAVHADRNLLQSSEHFKAKLCCCCACGCVDPEKAPRLDASVTVASASHLFGTCIMHSRSCAVRDGAFGGVG
jgi:hypothetical protein